jgi:hypothetical protein
VLSALQRRAQDERGAPRADAVTAPADPALKALHRRIVELESDLVGTTEILKNLADQHAQLVATIEALRQQTRVLVWTSAVLAAALIGLVLWLAFR